jgi:hypothetical protein
MQRDTNLQAGSYTLGLDAPVREVASPDDDGVIGDSGFEPLRVAYHTMPLEAVLDAVVRSAEVRLRPLARGTGLVVLRTGWGGELRAATAGAEHLEPLQSATAGGPAFEAIAGKRPVVVADLDGEQRWQELTSAARRAGIAAILAVPLDAEPIGSALTFYLVGRPRSGLLGELRPVVDDASLVVANAVAFARHELVAAHLKEALESRDLIGQAKGVLMARRAMSSENAFAVLRDMSQRTNRKLRDVAQYLVENGELP